MNDVKDLLVKARSQLLKRGWRKGAMGDYTEASGRVCALGAVLAAVWEDLRPSPGTDRAETLSVLFSKPSSTLGRAMGVLARAAAGPTSTGSASTITLWNDNLNTTRPDVLRAFTKAIEEA